MSRRKFRLRDVSLLIPFRPDGGYRDAALRWLLQRYRAYLPEVEICIGRDDSPRFCRSRAINRAAKKATRPIFLIADADIICDRRVVKKALKKLRKAPWVIPYRRVLNLSKEATERILAGDPRRPVAVRKRDVVRVRKGRCGGLNLVPRSVFNAVGGFDERFVGWGYEDSAFARAADTLCGRHKRVKADIYHLWHLYDGHARRPSNAERREKSKVRLRARYRRASGKPRAMRRLLREAKAARKARAARSD